MKVKCGTCGLEVTNFGFGKMLQYPDGAEVACKLTAPKYRPGDCDAMHKAIAAAEHAERQRPRL